MPLRCSELPSNLNLRAKRERERERESRSVLSLSVPFFAKFWNNTSGSYVTTAYKMVRGWER